MSQRAPDTLIGALHATDTSPAPAATSATAPNLVVDLDGCLIATDMLQEGALRLVARNPLLAFALPFWLLRGRAYLKEQVAQRTQVSAANLPYNAEVLALIDEYRKRGARIILATASHRGIAESIARHVGRFDVVLATQEGNNLKGPAKLEEILRVVGDQPFAYVGNDLPDLAIWERSAEIHVVNPAAGVLAGLRRMGKAPTRVISNRKPFVRAVLKAMRPHQWLKNVLVAVPIFAAHRIGDPSVWLPAAMMFFAYGLAASSIYLVNDLVDVDADRIHPRKRARPFAAGDLSLLHGVAIAPLLLLAGVALAFSINVLSGLLVLLYSAASTAYSLLLKRFVVVDVITLAGLYTLRILAGAAATQIVPSFWLLAFSMFFFLCLATMKRAAELQALAAAGGAGAEGRDYLVRDLPAIRALGVTSGYVSVLVLALYMNAPETASHYATPQVLWAVCVILLYWLGRLWVKTDRGEMHDDPVVYALTDWNSRTLGVICVGILMISTIRWF